MPIVCRLCLAKRGLKGSDIVNLPRDDEELAAHVESEHHIPVKRDGETEEECLDRFYREHPEAQNPATCKCPACCKARSYSGC